MRGSTQNNFTVRAEEPWIDALDDMVALYRLGSRITALDTALELFRALAGLPPMPNRVGTGTVPPSYRWTSEDMLKLLNNAENVKSQYTTSNSGVQSPD
jgi:hypothetical protein